MKTKSIPVQIKATADQENGLQDGQFRAVVSVFGNKDSYGDVVLPGAFADTLAEWKASGNPIPIYWSHRMDDPDFNLGEVLEADETALGLEILGALDLDAPKSAQVYRLLKGRRVTQFSFAYDVVEGASVERDGEHFYELRKLKLYEVGPTPIGANQETELLAVKAASEQAVAIAAAVKAGRVLSAKNEDALKAVRDQLTTAATSLTDVLSTVDSSDDQSKASTSGPAKDPTPDGAKSDEPSRGVPVGPWDHEFNFMALGGTQ